MAFVNYMSNLLIEKIHIHLLYYNLMLKHFVQKNAVAIKQADRILPYTILTVNT